jgi:hypothetical protein
MKSGLEDNRWYILIWRGSDGPVNLFGIITDGRGYNRAYNLACRGSELDAIL